MIHDTSPSASTCAMASSSRQMALWINAVWSPPDLNVAWKGASIEAAGDLPEPRR